MFAALANPHGSWRSRAGPRRCWASSPLGLIGVGLWLGLNAPPDYQQGETVQIMFIHVPAAWIAMLAYACLGGASFFSLVFRHALADAAAKAAAPLGAAFTGAGPGHRLALGPADVGRLVGVGCAPDLGAGAVPALPRLHGACAPASRTRPRRRARLRSWPWSA